MTQVPYVAAFSDPAVTNVQALRQLGGRNDRFAVAAAANPNLSDQDVLDILGTKKMTVEVAEAVGRNVFPTLSAQVKADLICKLHDKSPRAAVRLLNVADPEAWGLLAAAFRNRKVRRPDAFREAARESFTEAVTRHARETCDPSGLPAGFADAIAAFAIRDADAIVRGWQLRDLTVMEELLTQLGTVPVLATLCVPGLADAWFDKGGEWRVAACHDPALDPAKVVAWLAGEPWREPDAFAAVIHNVRIPVEALRDAVVRSLMVRWPDPGQPVGGAELTQVRGLADRLDWRYEALATPLRVDGPVEEVSDPTTLRSLLDWPRTLDDRDDGLCFALMGNPHVTGDRLRSLVRRYQGRWTFTTTPAMATRLADAADRFFGAGGELRVNGHGSLPQSGSCSACLKPEPAATEQELTAARAAEAARLQHTTLGYHLTATRRVGNVLVSPLAPELAAILPDGDAWFTLFTDTDNDWYRRVDREEILDRARFIAAEYGVQNVSPQSAVSSILGDPLGD